MIAKNLVYPFAWKDRRVYFQDSILYVPDYYSDYSLEPWGNISKLFCRSAPLHIEYCSGNGEWLVEQAKKNPFINWIGVEKRFERVKKIWFRMKNSGVENILIICGEAHTATQHFLRDATISAVFINFPDPWHKKKHAKHRLTKKTFVDQVTRILTSQGRISLVSDDLPYIIAAAEIMRENKNLLPLFSSPFYSELDMASYGSSFFSRLWEGKGLSIYQSSFEKMTVQEEKYANHR